MSWLAWATAHLLQGLVIGGIALMGLVGVTAGTSRYLDSREATIGTSVAVENEGSEAPSPIFLQELPERIEQNVIYLIGEWKAEEKYSISGASNVRIVFHYTTSRSVHLVARASKSVKLTILLDGQPAPVVPGLVNVNGETFLFVESNEFEGYQLTQNDGKPHVLQIIISDAGLVAAGLVWELAE